MSFLKRRLPLFVFLACVVLLPGADMLGQSTNDAQEAAPLPGQPLLPTATATNPNTEPVSSALPSSVAHEVRTTPDSAGPSDSTPQPEPGQPLLPTAGAKTQAAAPISSALPTAQAARTIPAGTSGTKTSNSTAHPQPGQPLFPTAGPATHPSAVKSVSSALTAPALSSHSAAVNAHLSGAGHETLGLNGAKAEPAHQSKSSDGRYRFDFIVTDGDGHPIPGLTAQDIVIQDNQQPRTIQSFRVFDGATQPEGQPTPQPSANLASANLTSANPATTSTPAVQELPVELVLVLDSVNTDAEHFALIRKATEDYLHQNGGQLAQPTSLVLFSTSGMTTHEHPTQNGNALVDFIAQNKDYLQSTAPTSDLSNQLERFKFSMQIFHSILDSESKKPGRKELIWLGTGWPLIHDTDAAKFVDEKHQFAKKKQLEEIAALTNQLREARVAVYNIRLTPADGAVDTSYENYLQELSAVEQSDAAYLSLQVLAINSGGRVLDTSNDLVGQIARCAADAHGYYTVSFNSNEPEASFTYHPFEIHLNQPGAEVHTNKGYYAVH